MTTLLGNPMRPALLAAARSPKLQASVSRMRATRRLVDRFVAGESEQSVLYAVDGLVKSGMFVSIDHLGEDTTDAATASAVVDAYLSLLQGLTHVPAPSGLARPLEISIKLSALGQGIDHHLAVDNARKICAAADEAGVWVTVDAEDHRSTASRLSIVRELRRDHPSLGTVLQAYLVRTEDDCTEFSGSGSRIRLCKGAYDEPAGIAFQRPADVSDSYVRCLRILMDGDGYPMVASHDPAMIDAAGRFADAAGRSADDHEYQMLYGIRAQEQGRLVESGLRVRVYVPYGDQWYGYFMRRLAERPANLMFFVRSLVSRS